MVKLLENDFKTEIISILKESREINVMRAKSNMKKNFFLNVIVKLKTARLQVNEER